jgi:hypothetical protein
VQEIVNAIVEKVELIEEGSNQELRIGFKSQSPERFVAKAMNIFAGSQAHELLMLTKYVSSREECTRSTD